MNELENRTIIASVKERHDIVSVIGRHMNLNRSRKGICPFHEESEPSFSINEKGQYFHCFGCGVGGDVIRFIELIENKPFIEALKTLAGEAGVSIPVMSNELTAKIARDNSKHHILSVSAAYYHKQLTEEAINYLQRRGFLAETIDRFQIGWADGNLKVHLIKKCEFNIQDCIEAGVLKRSDNGSTRDFFTNRIVFPNQVLGQVVHLTGRQIGDGQPKYLHLPGHIDHFFNENALRGKTVLVTEGVTDAIAAEQAGHSAIALFGVNGQKQDQIAKLEKCDNLYLCFDGDRAGRESAQKLATAIGDRCRIVELPDGIDLCEYMAGNTPEKLQELLENAKDLIKYQLEAIPPDLEKVQLSDALAPTLQHLALYDQGKAEAYLTNDIKERFGLKREEIDAYRKQMMELRAEARKFTQSKQKSSQGNPNYSAVFDGLVDVVEIDGEPAYLVRDGADFVIREECKIDGKLNTPPRSEKIPWLLANGEQVLEIIASFHGSAGGGLDATLYDDLRAYLYSVSELPDPSYYDLLTTWVLQTYLMEKFCYTPTICLYAVPERGKTRTGSALVNLAYRGMRVESLREAFLFRMATYWKAAIFFDVMDLWAKAERENSTDILLSRFERGAKVPRVLHPDQGPHEDTTFFDVFGPTIIGTNKNVHHILETRAIQINMPETTRSFDKPITPESTLLLKERLLAFRARHMGRSLPEVSRLVRGRLGDILKPLHRTIMLTRPERETDFKQLADRLQDERKMDKSETIEALILRSVLQLSDTLKHGRLAVKDITDHLNRGRSENAKHSYQSIGRYLWSLGLQKGKTGDGGSAMIWNIGLLARLCHSYGLQCPSDTSETSVSPEVATDHSDITDVSDVSDGSETAPSGSPV